MVNRKLVRPNLAELKEKMVPARPYPGGGVATATPATAPPAPAREGGGSPHPASGPPMGPRRRPVPPDSTSAEAFYYVKQMNSRTPMVVVLGSGEQLRGHIEWYDRNCIKVNREGEPNLLVFKHSIRYLYKQEEEGQGSEGAPTE